MSEAAPTWWYFRRANREAGPLTWDELTALLSASKLSGEDEVSQDRATWKPAGAVQAMHAGAGGAGVALNYSGGLVGPTMLSGSAAQTVVGMAMYVRIMSVLILLVAVLALAAALLMGIFGISEGNPGLAAAALVYMFLGLLYLAPAIYLSQCATNFRLFGRTNEPAFLNKGLSAQKSFWKYTAITALVVIGLYLLIIVAAVMLGVLSGAHMV
ncbi:MAG TPA: DUF4339 domain-containing protein [Phycisphaerae bacterium]|nr:DUF4339 domain-containing protein [Phycisphaerae bacterium]